MEGGKIALHELKYNPLSSQSRGWYTWRYRTHINGVGSATENSVDLPMPFVLVKVWTYWIAKGVQHMLVYSLIPRPSY